MDSCLNRYCATGVDVATPSLRPRLKTVKLTSRVIAAEEYSFQDLNGRIVRELMVSKCANPKCRAVFRYLHEGKLFEFEIKTIDGSSGEGSEPKHHETLSREIECFWLCASCALTMTLVRESHADKVALVRLQNGVERGGDMGDSATVNPCGQRWQ